MNGAIAWFARNSVAANVMMALLIAGGLITLPQIKREVFPSIELDVISVSVEYPGAAPAEVERAICLRVEQALQGLQGIKSLRSSASEGHGSVAVELLAGEDPARRLNDIRGRVNSIDGFPEAARRPIVHQVDVRFQVLNVAIAGDIGERALKLLGERTRDEIASLPGVTDVELVAARADEVSIELSEEALRRYGLGFDDVAGAIRRASLDLPGGTVRSASGDILLRTRGQAYSGSDYEKIALVTYPDGRQLMLGDVATVVDGFRETDQRSLFDGNPAVLVQVYRVGNQSALQIAEEVRGYLERTRHQLPQGASLTLTQDDSRFLRDRLETLTRNARSGFVLVLLVLALFLRLRLALWVSLGIPISFLGALWLMPALDVSINLISLMGFIVVLGIVVDDAIVVGENAHAHGSRTSDPVAAAIEGARGVATPVTFGILTTVAAFAPMLFVAGPMGRVARVIPIVVCICLFFSLIESLFVLPAHLSHGGITDARTPRTRLGKRWQKTQDAISVGLDCLIHDVYRPSLERILEWRHLAVATGVALLFVTAGLLGGGWVRFVFQPDVDSDVMVAYVTMPQGTPVEVTRDAVEQLTRAADGVERRFDPQAFRHVFASVGQQPYRIRQATGPSSFESATATGAHLGEVQIEVASDDVRSHPVGELLRLWREAAGQIPGAEELSFNASLLRAGAPLAIQLDGASLLELRSAARELKERLAVYPGVVDLSDSFRGGKQELELTLLPTARALGLTLQDLARQVRQAFYGLEVQRFQRGRDEVRVMVRYPAARRRSLGDLEHMMIRTTDGAAVPFAAVAQATLTEGYATIKRKDGRRIVTVTADVDNEVANANEIVADLKRHLPELVREYPGILFSFEGEQRDQNEFLTSLGRGWAMALVAIYALLAVPLRSYVQPFIIMTAIPFGLVGAVWGHVLMGHDFSMFSVIGIVALSGVVVNDSLVLVDWINRERQRGAPLASAIREAGIARFRAILLTSLTTFAGLSPLLLEESVQAQMLIPMAISLAFGVMFATAITLFLVPSAYLILEDARALGRRWIAASELGSAAVTPSRSDQGARLR